MSESYSYCLIGDDRLYLTRLSVIGSQERNHFYSSKKKLPMSGYRIANLLKDRCQIGQTLDHKTTEGLRRMAIMIVEHDIYFSDFVYMDSEYVAFNLFTECTKTAFCAKKDELGIWMRIDPIEEPFRRGKLLKQLTT